MTTIGPGTPLICVKVSSAHSEWAAHGFTNPLSVNSMYFCERVMCGSDDYDCGCGSQVGLTLKGVNPFLEHPERGRLELVFCSCEFRPLNDGDTSMIDHEEEFVEDYVSRLPITPDMLIPAV